MRNTSYTLFSLLLLFSAYSTAGNAQSSIFEELSMVDEISLELPLDSISKQRNTATHFQATLQYKLKKEKKSWNIELKTRGKYRKRICSVPPLSMRFHKEDLQEKGYQKWKKVKMVTPCIKNWESDEYILREYLAYKLYELISDKHIRTHLVKIKYKNSQSGKTIKRYGILIEDEEETANRLDVSVCEDCYNYSPEKIDQQAARIQDLFQFMIGNVDYSLIMVRNIKLMIPSDSSNAFIIPYDFDFCGLVNAPYAVPNVDLKLSSCRERRFLGHEQDDNELKLASAYFQSKQDEILDYVMDFKKLSRDSRVDVYKYLLDFFKCLKKGEILDYTPANKAIEAAGGK